MMRASKNDGSDPVSEMNNTGRVVRPVQGETNARNHLRRSEPASVSSDEGVGYGLPREPDEG